MTYEQSMFGYFATYDVFDRLSRAVSEQVKFGFGTAQRSYLFTDRPPGDRYGAITDFFEDRIVVSNPCVEHVDKKPIYALSKARNAAIRFARTADVTWFYFCDADTVMYNIELPGQHQRYVIPYVYWQKSPEETVAESIKKIDAEGIGAFSEGNSWFMLHREIFENLDFNENIYSYGFEDLEFCHRVQKMGYRKERCSTHIVHLYHSDEARNIDWILYERNRLIHEAVVLLANAGYRPDWRKTKRVKTTHSEWESDMYFDYASYVVVNLMDQSISSFEDNGQIVRIHRSDCLIEMFEKNSSGLKYVGNR